MANGVRLDLVTDTRDIKKGFAEVEDALEDVADSLDDVAKDGEDATEKMEKSFAELAKETKKEAKDMGGEVSKSYKRMEDDAGDATKQMRTDAASEAEQVASSFDGSAESIVDGFQGAAASMFSGFGPAGAAAGIAAAAGIGLVTSHLTKTKEAAEEAAAAQWDLAQDIIDSGTYAVTEIQKVNLLREWLGDEEEQAKYAHLIETLGISASDFGAGLFDIGEKREEVEGVIRGLYKDQRDELEGFVGLEQTRLEKATEINYQEELALETLRDQDEVLGGALKTAIEFGETMADVGLTVEGNKAVLDDTEKAILRMAETDATPIFNFQSWYDELDEFQRRLLQLRAPTLDVQVREIR